MSVTLSAVTTTPGLTEKIVCGREGDSESYEITIAYEGVFDSQPSLEDIITKGTTIVAPA